jgi:hypothetical protein
MLYHSIMNATHHHHAPKLSRNQTEILSCLRKSKEPMSAYAILDQVRTAGISHPPTVYRALAELIEKGMGTGSSRAQPSSPAVMAPATASSPSPSAVNAERWSRFHSPTMIRLRCLGSRLRRSCPSR